ncbi:unnamed protein product, partial [Iphiclides podalirius]
MSARNYLSAREKNIIVNRNLGFSFKAQPFSEESLDRVSTPFSDFFSDSETGTPDFRSEESDSSSGSALRRNTEEATKSLEAEWEKIERTLYNEEGEKTTRPLMVEECKQWRQLHPQLRILGRGIPLPKIRLCNRPIDHDEVIAMHYSDYEQFSESEERLSQSSTDVTPQNSPRVLGIENPCEPRLSREKITIYPRQDDDLDFGDAFSSLLQITPIQIRSPYKKRQSHSILRSELASSRWMRGSRPDSSVNCGRSSAKSFVSLDTGKYSNILCGLDVKNVNGRVVTARHRDMGRLEPIYTPEPPHTDVNKGNGPMYLNRKVSLPPLSMEEERRKISSIGSARKQIGKTKKSQQKNSLLDRGKHNC